MEPGPQGHRHTRAPTALGERNSTKNPLDLRQTYAYSQIMPLTSDQNVFLDFIQSKFSPLGT